MSDTVHVRGKRLLIGVGGGISAYKVASLVSQLVQCDALVDVIVTPAALQFVGTVTFQGLTRRPVFHDLYLPGPDGQLPHVDLGRSADLCLIAPATADLIARLAHGLANDLLTTTVLALRAPLLIAPAMDVGMYDHPATRANVALLRDRGVTVVGPEEGRLASGLRGLGRMSEPETLLTAIERQFSGYGEQLRGVRVVVTAGGTHEPIDPVRYIGNRSSGKMGYAFARVAAAWGADVTLISGPSALPAPPRVTIRSIGTARELQAAVEEAATAADVVIMAAAVADYRVERPAEQKLKRAGDDLTLRLVENPDIVAGLAARSPRPLLVAFAAETEQLIENARAKLRRKGVDLIVANDVSAAGSGFGTDTNEATLLFPDGRIEPLPLMPKDALAGIVLDRVRALLDARQHATR